MCIQQSWISAPMSIYHSPCLTMFSATMLWLPYSLTLHYPFATSKERMPVSSLWNVLSPQSGYHSPDRCWGDRQWIQLARAEEGQRLKRAGTLHSRIGTKEIGKLGKKAVGQLERKRWEMIKVKRWIDLLCYKGKKRGMERNIPLRDPETRGFQFPVSS